MTDSILAVDISSWVKNNPEKAAENRAKHYARAVKKYGVKVSMEQYYASIDKKAKQEASPKRVDFLSSKEWKAVRNIVLSKYGRLCMRCGSKDRIQIDHIKPRSKYPQLQLDVNNLQVLCWECNKDKAARYEKDYRSSKQLLLPMRH